MNEHNKKAAVRADLQEKYEDVMFEIMMDGVMKKQGEEFLEESRRLNADPDFEYPEELDRKCQKAMAQAFARNKRAKNLRKLRRAGNFAAIVVAVIAVSGMVLFTTVEAVRANVINYLVETFDYGRGTQIHAVPGFDDDTPATVLSPRRVPDGYQQTDISDNGRTTVITYENEAHDTIFYIEGDSSTAPVVYTEDADQIYETTINTYEALMVVKGTETMLLWMDSDNSLVCQIFTSNLSDTDTAQVAESCYG